MTELLLDTNILIEWFTDGPSAPFLARRIKNDRPLLSTSVISVAEFLVKAGKKEVDMLAELLSSGALLLRDVSGLEMALSAAQIRRDINLRMPDAFILATAVATGATLFTRDQRLAKLARGIVHVEIPGV